MKVTALECFAVKPRWLFLKISTDGDVAGWGEATLEGRTGTVMAAIAELSEYVVGRDPGHIEDIWHVLYSGGFYRGGPVLMSALSGIDQALWDIQGKRHGLPVHAFFGGPVRTSVQAYSWVGGDRPQGVAAAAKERVAAGFGAVKMNACADMHIVDTHAKIDEAIARVAAVREAVGPDFGIAVDFHGRVHRAMAKTLIRELAPYNLMFVEEPVLPEHEEALRDVARAAPMPIALGERLYSRWDFKRVLSSGLVDIVQPDLSHAGGLTETRKILAMAEAYDIAAAPHCPLGPIALAASLQIDAVSPGVFIQEQSSGIHYNEGADVLTYVTSEDTFAVTDGAFRVPTAPGLGVAVDEERVRRVAQESHAWRNPIWRNADGTLAEW